MVIRVPPAKHWIVLPFVGAKLGGDPEQVAIRGGRAMGASRAAATASPHRCRISSMVLSAPADVARAIHGIPWHPMDVAIPRTRRGRVAATRGAARAGIGAVAAGETASGHGRCCRASVETGKLGKFLGARMLLDIVSTGRGLRVRR